MSSIGMTEMMSRESPERERLNERQVTLFVTVPFSLPYYGKYLDLGIAVCLGISDPNTSTSKPTIECASSLFDIPVPVGYISSNVIDAQLSNKSRKGLHKTETKNWTPYLKHWIKT